MASYKIRSVCKALQDGVAFLDLAFTCIDDEGARVLADALRGNTALRHLHLGRNLIGDEGARALADVLRGNTTLTHLYLYCNQIGDEGARALAEALRGNIALTLLFLWGNRIGDEGARALADALRVNGTLKTLSLSANRFSDEGARALADALEDGNACTLSEDEMRKHFYERIGCYAANVLRRYVRSGNRSLKELHVAFESHVTSDRIHMALRAPYRHNNDMT